jgi:hypothetical protein
MIEEVSRALYKLVAYAWPNSPSLPKPATLDAVPVLLPVLLV